jgi:DNA repair exonuclease SbcCD ATPase subunit
MLDSITFALFGKPFRKINIPQLVNSINNKDCVVEVLFETGSDTYRVVRCLKPKKFEIYRNDNLLKQNAKAKDYQTMLEDQILKMNYKSFTQIVTLGSSSFIPFMQLTPADRRQIIENILNIDIFSSMNFILKAKMSMNKERLSTLSKEIEILKEKIDIQDSNIETLKRSKNDNISNNIKKIKTTEQEIENLQLSVTKLLDNISEFDNIENKKIDLTSKLNKCKSITSSFIDKVKKINDDLQFYSKNESCPTCDQKLSSEFKEEKNKSLLDIKTKTEDQVLKLKENCQLIKLEIENVEVIISKINNTKFEINEKNNSISAGMKYIKSLNSDTFDENSFDSGIEESTNKKNQYQNELDTQSCKLEKLKDTKNNYNIMSMLLKDSGIKSKIIKNYLPVMNEIINKYLNEMNFFVSFTLDEEFNEEIKSRHRDTFSYMNFSEGEKARIDLAILLAWREIAKIKNSSHCNLLILDEVFDSSLDSLGVDDLSGVLKNLAASNSVYVITHKKDQLIDKFEKTISFNKRNNFSKMKMS